MYWLILMVIDLVLAKPFIHGRNNADIIDNSISTSNEFSSTFLKEMHIPQYMADLYTVLSKEQPNVNLLHNGNVVRSYFNQGSPKEEHEARKYFFDVSDINEIETLTKAELHIYMYPTLNNHKRFGVIQLSVKNLVDNHTVSSRILSSTGYGWLVFPVTKLVSHWIKTQHVNKGIRITVRFIYGQEETIYFGTKNSVMKEPILVTFTSDMNQYLHLGNGRRKRDMVLNPCRVVPLSVPMDEIGLGNLGLGNHIVTPLSFRINQCAGQCVGQQQSNHAILQGLYAAVTGGQEASFPCCAPLKLGNLSILVRDEKIDIIKLLILEKTVVKSCSCQ